MKDVHIDCETDGESLSNACRYLKQIGVQRIEELSFNVDDDFTDSEAIVSFIKDFDVVCLQIYGPEPNNALHLNIRSFFQLNLKEFFVYGRVPIDIILEIESSIPEISFPQFYKNISKGQLTNILSKIQTGSLRRLTVDFFAVDWDNYDKLPFDHQGPLPEDRPLLFTRNASDIDEYWFLHYNGGVTKFVNIHGPGWFCWEIFKCEPWELPCALRKNEEILKDLAEKRPRVCCTSEQFSNFTATFEMLDPSHKGPLPSARPLYCKVNKNRFWMLDEDENLMECDWKEGSGTRESYDPHKPKVIDHPALKKYIFWKLLQQIVKYKKLEYFCKGLNEFDSWLEDFEILDFDYSGELPNTRPLVFKGKINNIRVLLLEDQLLECEFNNYAVKVKHCHCLNCPPSLVTSKTLVEILKEPNSMNINISFDVFRDGLKQFKNSILVLQKRLFILETSKTEFWYLLDGVVRKVEWKKGRLSISGEVDSRCSLIFRYFAENPGNGDYSLRMELEEFRNCLEQFTVVSFDDSGAFTSDSPLAFVKNEIRHICRKGPSRRPRCKCSVHSVLVWFLWNGTRLTKCSWGKEEPKKVLFGTDTSDDMEVPAILKSKEHLKALLQAKYNESSQFQWFGSVDDFLDNLSDYVKLPFNHDGTLPARRPLLFENNSNKENPVYFILRDDGTVIKCEWLRPHFSFSSPLPGYDGLPPTLMNMF